jgi:hypothetical protein
MDELAAAAAVEIASIGVDAAKQAPSDSTPGESTGNVASDVLGEGVNAGKENEPARPTANGARVPALHIVIVCSVPPSSLPDQYPLTLSSSPRSGTRALPSSDEELDKEDVTERAIALLLGGHGEPEASGKPAIASVASNELVHHAKIVVLELFEQRRAEVRMLSETARLDQEEALAYLLADLLGYELLADEARTIGKADQRLKDKASTDRSKARAAAAKCEAHTAGLEARLGAIDEQLERDRRELARAVVPLPWPDRRTVIGTRKRPEPEPEPEPPPLQEWIKRLEVEAAKADAALEAAKQHLVGVQHTLSRAEKTREAALQRVRSLHHSASEDKWQQLQAEWEGKAARVTQLIRDEGDAKMAVTDARLEADLAHIDLDAALRDQRDEIARERWKGYVAMGSQQLDAEFESVDASTEHAWLMGKIPTPSPVKRVRLEYANRMKEQYPEYC